ncbi:MAG: hypothetical protein WA484_02585, partial [Solirubrobacteraceae bacterium]
TTYHYRLAASNPGGTAYGADETFATPEYPASAIAQTPVLAASLGFLDPEPAAGKPTNRSLTRAQKLTNALKACGHKPKRQRPGCQREARKKYRPVGKK